MGTSNLKSAAITALDLIPPQAPTAGEGGAGFVQSIEGYVTAVAADAAGSTYKLVRLPSQARLKQLILDSEAQGAGKINIGANYSDSTKDGTPVANQGAVIDDDAFATDVDLASAVKGSDVTNESGTFTYDKRNMPLWQALGLAADPGGYIDIVATVNTTDITTGTGKIGLRAVFVIQ